MDAEEHMDAVADDEAVEIHSSSLLSFSHHYVNLRAQNLELHLGKAAADLQMGRGAVKQRLHALSEASIRHQKRSMDNAMAYVKQMSGFSLEAILSAEHCMYDETPMKIRTNVSDGKGETCKVFVVQQSWSLLFRTIPEESCVGPDGPDNYVVLRGHLAPMMRVVSKGTGEGIRRVVCSTQHTPAAAATTPCKTSVRVSEADNLAANNKPKGCSDMCSLRIRSLCTQSVVHIRCTQGQRRHSS